MIFKSFDLSQFYRLQAAFVQPWVYIAAHKSVFISAVGILQSLFSLVLWSLSMIHDKSSIKLVCFFQFEF